MPIKSLLPALAAAGVIAAGVAPPALASSHREAPLITQTPKLDGTDFYMFRSYEPGRSGYVVLIANYLPLQDPYGGPNYFNLETDAYYDINIDNTGSGVPDITFRFKFTDTSRQLALNIGGKQVPVPLVAVGPIAAGGNPNDTQNENVFETYTLSLLTAAGSSPVSNAANGRTSFGKPLDNIGAKTLPDYAAYASAYVHPIKIPGCASNGRVFVGQRKDPFVVNLGETFDLVNYAHPVGEQFNNSAHDDLADKNVTTLALEVPIACLTNGSDPVIGGWTTASKIVTSAGGSISLQQVSRLGHPLVNEVVIGLPDKDKFNASVPKNDAQFGTYVTNPTLPTIIASLFAADGVKAPTAFPRTDLVAVFLTGITGLNAPKQLAQPSEELRLNTSIAPTAFGKQSRLGVIGGDNAGYPNGRRLGDDVVDIALRVVMGRLYTLGLFGTPADAPSGGLDFTDGAYVDDTFFSDGFPFEKTPIAGSPQP
jgi:hypothetical protein